jgi:hypothetical protein
MYSGLYSAPVAVKNGFYYDYDGVGLSTRMTKQEDGYEFKWDISPHGSGVVLAEVIVAGGTVSSITDKRHLNVLKFKEDDFDDNVVNTWDESTWSFTGSGLAGPQFTIDAGPSITPGTDGLVTLSGNDLKTLKDKYHIPNTDTGTTAKTFYVGVGSQGKNLQGLPIRIRNVSSSLAGFKLKQIDPIFIIADSTENAIKIPVTFSFSPLIDQNVRGAFATNTFTINNITNNKIFAKDELVGHVLYLRTHTEYEYVLDIINNDLTDILNDSDVNNIEAETKIYFRNTDGIDLTLSTSDVDQESIYIYNPAPSYKITATPTSVEYPTVIKEGDIRVNMRRMSVDLNLVIGAEYTIKANTVEYGRESEKTILLKSGRYSLPGNRSYYEVAENVEYFNPLFVDYPKLKKDLFTINISQLADNNYSILIRSGIDGFNHQMNITHCELNLSGKAADGSPLNIKSLAVSSSDSLADGFVFRPIPLSDFVGSIDLKIRYLTYNASRFNGYLEKTITPETSSLLRTPLTRSISNKTLVVVSGLINGAYSTTHFNLDGTAGYLSNGDWIGLSQSHLMGKVISISGLTTYGTYNLDYIIDKVLVAEPDPESTKGGIPMYWIQVWGVLSGSLQAGDTFISTPHSLSKPFYVGDSIRSRKIAIVALPPAYGSIKSIELQFDSNPKDSKFRFYINSIDTYLENPTSNVVTKIVRANNDQVNIANADTFGHILQWTPENNYLIIDAYDPDRIYNSAPLSVSLTVRCEY